METAVFGGGCFWCTEAVFKGLRGVISVLPGYAGGHVEHPTYEQVSGGDTGHAEVIKIEFDPKQITFRELLTVFFATHDPTTPNRQGNDIGSQYRSVIFYTSNAQQREARSFIDELNGSSEQGPRVITELAVLSQFYEAEDYHKNYYARNADAPYCQIVINPKLEKVQQKFAALLQRSEPESV